MLSEWVSECESRLLTPGDNRSSRPRRSSCPLEVHLPPKGPDKYRGQRGKMAKGTLIALHALISTLVKVSSKGMTSIYWWRIFEWKRMRVAQKKPIGEYLPKLLLKEESREAPPWPCVRRIWESSSWSSCCRAESLELASFTMWLTSCSALRSAKKENTRQNSFTVTAE